MSVPEGNRQPPVGAWAELEARLLARPRSSAGDDAAVRDRVDRVLALAGSPQRELTVIHITGTNAKSTTARIIDSLLSASGLRVARFTGPHLHSLAERITLGGTPVPEARLLAAHIDLAPALARVEAEDGPLPFFATLTALALTAFAQLRPDVAVIEVGIGGRVDATNVVDAEVAVICPVAMDHADRLGDSLAAIAQHKAGIIKPGATAVIAAQTREVTRILTTAATQVDATPVRVARTLRLRARRAHPGGQTVSFQGYGALHHALDLPLLGRHQADNALTAIVATQEFLARRGQTLGRDALRRGLAGATSPGQLERVREHPRVLVDASHNPAGMAATVAALGEAFDRQRPVVVFAPAGDKDAAGMLSALAPHTSGVILTRCGPRGAEPHTLAPLAARFWSQVDVVDGLGAAIERACACSSAGVLITGSVATAGAARELLARTTAH